MMSCSNRSILSCSQSSWCPLSGSTARSMAHGRLSRRSGKNENTSVTRRFCRHIYRIFMDIVHQMATRSHQKMAECYRSRQKKNILFSLSGRRRPVKRGEHSPAAQFTLIFSGLAFHQDDSLRDIKRQNGASNAFVQSRGISTIG